MSNIDRSKVGSAEFFKGLEDIHTADIRLQNNLDGNHALENFHFRIQNIQLNAYVPNDILINFETAKNTLFYSYFSYRLSIPATMVALATLEMAIVKKAEISSYKGCMNGLHQKLKTAFLQNWIDIKTVASPLNVPSDLSQWKLYTDRAFLPYFINLRNSLAHELSVLNFPWRVCEDLETVARMINELFKGHSSD